MPPAESKRPSCRGDSRAAEADRIHKPITSENTRGDAVEQAASWYAANRRDCPHPIIAHLRARFGLSAIEAVVAIRRAA